MNSEFGSKYKNDNKNVEILKFHKCEKNNQKHVNRYKINIITINKDYMNINLQNI